MRLIDADKLRTIRSIQSGDFNSIETIQKWIDDAPTIDAVPVVRCKDCKHRILNTHYGDKNYLPIKARCELDTGDPYSYGRPAERDDWFCADGERR